AGRLRTSGLLLETLWYRSTSIDLRRAPQPKTDLPENVRSAGRIGPRPVEVRPIGPRRLLMRRTTSLRLAAFGAAALAAAAMSPGWATGSPRVSAPVTIAPANAGGYGPGIYADVPRELIMTAPEENRA